MKNREIVVDLETLGTDSNAVIISISMIAFERGSDVVCDKIEVGLNVLEQMVNGAIVDKDTLHWWSMQDDEAKSSLYRLEPLTFDSASTFIDAFITRNGGHRTKLWGNGSGFDNVLLRNLYTRYDKKFIIPFWNDMDIRTLVELSGVDKRDFVFTGTKHNGLDDCIHQLNYMTEAFNTIKTESLHKV